MKPGPRGDPAGRLMDAALDFAVAVEFGDPLPKAWDKLRWAAERYVTGKRVRGRPRGSKSNTSRCASGGTL